MSNIRFSSLPAVVAPNSADAIPSTQADGIDRRYTPTQILIAAGATATPTASVPAEWDANKNLSASTLTGLTLTNTNILALQAVAGGTGAASGDITCSLGTIRYESFGG